MLDASFDKDLELPGALGKFLKLKSKGDKVKFMIAQGPKYTTKHFLDSGVVGCAKYNSEDKKAPCEFCDDFRERLEKAKNKVEEDAANKLAPVTNFYYPILDLVDGKAKIFQFTAKSIHYNIKKYADNGADVFNTVWLVERTEDPGNYYPVLNLGPQTLSKEQEEGLQVAKTMKLEGTESQSVARVDTEADDSLAETEPDQ